MEDTIVSLTCALKAAILRYAHVPGHSVKCRHLGLKALCLQVCHFLIKLICVLPTKSQVFLRDIFHIQYAHF